MTDDMLQPVEPTVAEPEAASAFAAPTLAAASTSDDIVPIADAPKLVQPEALPSAEKQQALDLAGQIDPMDAQCVLAFGTKPQNVLAGATENIIGKTKTSAAGDAGKTLNELLVTLREADMDSVTGQIESFLRKIPVIGGFFNEAQQIITAYEPIANKITKIEARLHEQQMTLLTDYENLNKMYDENAKYIKLLEIYVAAGKVKMDELQNKLNIVQAEPDAASDPLKAQAVDDVRRAIERLGLRIYDLELTRMVAIQTGPQIRLIQDGDERLATKIHTAVLTTIPLWKGQVAMAISLAHQKEALENVKGVTDTTNELLRKNSETLKQGTIDVRRESQRGIVDIETLKTTTDNLIATVEEAVRISAEGRVKRAEGEKAIAEMEERIKAVLADKKQELAAF